MISERQKLGFLDTIDDRYLELIRYNGDSLPNHPHITREALVLAARRDLGYSETTSASSIWSSLFRTWHRHYGVS